MIIDATDLIVGRMATRVAKKAQLGEEIKIVNCEKAVITGKKGSVLARFKQKRDHGVPLKGPYYPRMPDRIVRRMIRGMLPYKQEKGAKAYKRVKCYIGIPVELEGQKIETIDEADVKKLKNLDYQTIGEISKKLGAKIE